MSDHLIERLITFAESGNQQKVTLSSAVHQGWIMEVAEQGILLSTGFQEKTGKDMWFSFADLQQAELAYWDSKTSQWVAFTL